MEDRGLTASKFADKIGVPRSGLSHILSGRNKPSLDYVIKILDAFPEIDPNWLIKGVDSKPVEKMESSSSTPAENIRLHDLNRSLKSVNRKMENQSSKLLSKVVSNTSPEPEREERPTDAEIERIVYFYKDGTFKEYMPR